MVEVGVEGGTVTATAYYKPGSSDRISYPPLGDGDDKTINTGAATGYASVSQAATDAATGSASVSQAATDAATGSASVSGNGQSMDESQDSTESKYSIDSSKLIKIKDQSIPISDNSAAQMNSILFPKDDSKRDHFLLIYADGDMKIVKKIDMSNPIDPNTKINKRDYVTRVEIHVPTVKDKITIPYGENGPTFTISEVEPGEFTYMYTLMKKDETVISEPFNFFDIFPLTSSASKDDASKDDASKDDVSKDDASNSDASNYTMTTLTQSGKGGQLKRRIRRRVTRRRSNRRRRVQRRNTVNKRYR
jgi:hypothetical protein